MSKAFGDSRIMGPKLRAEVERQLLQDLRFYREDFEEGIFDWSESCQEGHLTTYLDGSLENRSNIAVKDQQGNDFATGWLDFIHGGKEEPLFVFWNFLTLYAGNKSIDVKKTFGIPEHIWKNLPQKSKELCAKSTGYDSYWHNDPLAVRGRYERS